MRSLVPLIVAALYVASCGSGDTGEATKTNAIKVGATNPYHEQLRNLSSDNQGLALRRAVQDSGQRCKRAEATAFQGEYKSLKMWTLRCSDTGDWALYLAANGDIQVRACKDAAQLSLPPCVIGPLEKS